MRAIEWRTAFEIGNDTIDDGHRSMVAAPNDAIGAFNEAASDRLADAVSEAIEVARRHFKDEETLLIEAGFRGIERHIAYHGRLLAEAEKVLDIFRSETVSPRLEPRLAELAHFLMAEIRDNDRELRECLTRDR